MNVQVTGEKGRGLGSRHSVLYSDSSGEGDLGGEGVLDDSEEAEETDWEELLQSELGELEALESLLRIFRISLILRLLASLAI